MNKGVVDDAARTAVAANNNASAGALTTLTGLNNAAFDAEIVKRPDTAAADLATIGGRHAHNPAIMASIIAHPQARNPLLAAFFAAPAVRMHFVSDAAKSLAAGQGLPTGGLVLTKPEVADASKQAAKKHGM